jgi:hypothetical protein
MMMEYVGHYSDTFYIASSITCNHVAKTHNLYLEGHHIWIKTCKTFWHFDKNMQLQIDMQQIVCPHGLCPCGYSRFGGIFPLLPVAGSAVILLTFHSVVAPSSMVQTV